MINIVLADDHQILRESVRKNFESAGEQVIGEASNGEDAVRLAQQLEPDVVVVMNPVYEEEIRTQCHDELGIEPEIVCL